MDMQTLEKSVLDKIEGKNLFLKTFPLYV